MKSWIIFSLWTSLVSCSPVLSSYGSRHAIGRNNDGTLQARSKPHRGVDIRGGKGDAVIAAADGVVITIGSSELAGISVTIKQIVPLNGQPRWTRYLHLSHVSVSFGDIVSRGEKLGTIGLFPFSGGVEHVHWMLCTNETCSGHGALGGTEDPIIHTVGCFSKSTEYQPDEFLLTYPVRC